MTDQNRAHWTAQIVKILAGEGFSGDAIKSIMTYIDKVHQRGAGAVRGLDETKVPDLVTDEFNRVFWPSYPIKVSRKSALIAFSKARQRASIDAIMEGLSRYVRTKPHDRAWLHASTFLNQDRWNDEAAPAANNSRPYVPSRPSLTGAIRRQFEGEGEI